MSSVREYPPKPMTANITTITGASYGNGTYSLSASNSAKPEWEAWKAFDGKLDKDSAWHSIGLGDGATGYKPELE